MFFCIALLEVAVMSYCMQFYFTKFSTGELITQGIMHNNIRGRSDGDGACVIYLSLCV